MTNRNLMLTTTCPFCGTVQTIFVDKLDYQDWLDGMSAQEAFPYLSDNDREAIISGICPDCWDDMFENSEDEDEDYYVGDCDDFDLEMGFDPYEGCWTGDC